MKKNSRIFRISKLERCLQKVIDRPIFKYQGCMYPAAHEFFSSGPLGLDKFLIRAEFLAFLK